MRTAFKEWAVVVDALGRGDQILILRKGGIHEGPRGFVPEHDRFLLFPTRFHQQRESVIEPARARFDAIAREFPPEDHVRLDYLAEVAFARNIQSLDQLPSLRPLHVWREEVLRDRFDWGAEAGVHALVVRVHRLAEPRLLPAHPDYGGCRSWIELKENVEIGDAVPVLPAADFKQRAREIEALLPTGAGRA